MRWLRRIFVAIVAIVLVAALSVWITLRGSLPQLDGEFEHNALNAAVSIERDALGTVTITAQNRDDVSFALGYVHAQERFFEMDLMRRSAAGELAALFGPVAVPTDRKARVHRMRARAEAAIALAPAEERQTVERYRDGVNAGLGALRARPFAYWLTLTEPEAWRNEDTLLVVDSMYFALNDASNTRELGFSRMHSALPPSAWNFLSASGGKWDAPLSGPAMRWPDAPSEQELDLRKLDPALLRGTEPPSGIVPGSNSFAVSGALTDGPAIVANDMHLDLRVPALWFRARLIYPNPRRDGQMIDVSGASLPGTPAIVAGSNRQIAWGFTNSYGDFTDWVRVISDDADASKYRTAAGSESLITATETILVKGADAVQLDVRETRWGPILAEDVDGVPLALAWTAHRDGAVNLELMQLEQAETVDEGVAIAQRSGMPAQNFLAADRFGHIAWTIAGRIPLRSGGFDPRLPADWSQADTGWNGWLAAENYPLITNPPWQRLWTANARLVDEGQPLAVFGDGGYDLGARQKQIRDGLEAREQFTPADMLAIQLDDRALFLEPWHKQLVAVLAHNSDDASYDSLREALSDWDGHASTKSAAYRIVRAWRNEVMANVLDGFAAAVRVSYPDFDLPKLSQTEHAVWELITKRPPHLLPPNAADWDGLLKSAVDRVSERMLRQAGDISERTWGERNTARIRHPLSRALPEFLAAKLDMPMDALPGDSNMPRVQAPSFGASERFAVAPGKEEEGYFQLPGGQSGHPLSQFYGAGHADWVDGKPTPFLPGVTQYRLGMKPSTN